MAGGRRSRYDPDDDPEPDDEDDEDDEEPRPRRKTARSRSRPKSEPSRPIRRWSSGSDDEGTDDAADRPRPKGGKPPVFWRARDSLWFEPLVGLAIVVVLLVALFAYTQNYPPIYVVESASMQHGSNDVLGDINTGDLVLAQKVANSTIVPYVGGLSTGHSTYGEYGDVLLYHPNGATGTPVIHRAILFLIWNPASGSYSAPDLDGLACGNAATAVYATPGTLNDCGTSNLTGTLELFHIGWKSASVDIPLSDPGLGAHSGYLTMGDNNFVGCGTAAGCTGEPDQLVGISTLVEPGWVVGVARGMIPWFGAVKLLVSGDAGTVPPQSWQFLGLTVAGVILAAFGVEYALRREGIETPLRKKEEEESIEEAADDEDEADGRGRRPWRFSLHPWRRSDEEDEEDREDERSRGKGGPGEHRSTSSSRRGRPRPRVKRGEKKPRHRPDDDDL